MDFKPFKETFSPDEASVRRVILVDDEEGILDTIPELIAFILSELKVSHEVLAFDSPASALRHISSSSKDSMPSLIISDIKMPDMPGDRLMTLINTVLKDKQAVGVKKAFMTGNDVQSDIVKGFVKKGLVDAVLAKPIFKKQLTDFLVEMLALGKTPLPKE